MQVQLKDSYMHYCTTLRTQKLQIDITGPEMKNGTKMAGTIFHCMTGVFSLKMTISENICSSTKISNR